MIKINQFFFIIYINIILILRMSELTLLEQVTLYIMNYRPDILSNFNWDIISKHSHITWNFIKNNRQYNWNLYYLTRNPNVTWEIATNNLDWDFDWEYLSN